ncbi:Peptidase-S9 domain-containing protein [Mycena kentingensis (nom. inval.)]|nr:Peptidase-S9 domain-containing protein [Mycena kentingensis (nom. inval.)]
MYQILSQLPVPKFGQFVSQSTIRIVSGLRDNANNVHKSIASTIPTAASGEILSGEDLGDVVASQYAPEGSVCYPRRAVVRETTDARRYIEIWMGTTLEASMELSEKHGEFYTDEFFSSFVFAPNSFSFAYVAEANEPKDARAKYRFTPPLGETFSGKKRPTVFVFRWTPDDTETQPSLVSLAPILAGHSILLGQPVFSSAPSEKDVFYATGYEYTCDGRLLGLKWCYNRPSGIWRVSIPDVAAEDVAQCVCTKLTPSDLSCRSPRTHCDLATGKQVLIWLSHASGGPHAGTFSLQAADIGTKTKLAPRVVVETVWEPRESDGFPGLYPDSGNLPSFPFLSVDGQLHIALTSTWGSRTRALLIGLDSGDVKDVVPAADDPYSYTVLATDGINRLIWTRSAANTPPEIILGQATPGERVSWKILASPYVPPVAKNALAQLRTSIIAIPNQGKTETVVVRRAESDATHPCVQSVHGGPHGYSTSGWSAEVAAYALCGYTISMPNYTGSVGFGEACVQALAGKCGSLDVEDCIATARHLVTLGISSEGSGKQFVMGGSHGGFLTAHLIGQYPDFFTAAAIRNPVMSTDPLSSDIPDWYFNEWAINYPMSSLPAGFPTEDTTQPDAKRAPPRRTPTESQAIYKTAPMAYVEAVRAHVLLHMGGSDVRVTPTHGIDYFHALKGRLGPGAEQEVDMVLFEKEGHSLDGVEASRVVWETTVDWFDKYRT